MESNTNYRPTIHDVPKCTCCGNIAPWKVEPIMTGSRWVIFIILLICGFAPGIFYLFTVLLVHGSKKKRSKICRKCKAENLFTFEY